MSIVSVDNIQPIGSGTTVTVNKSVTLESGNTNITGVCTATSFSGSGANLTSLPAQATIANNADNRIITGGSGVNLNGEANLTWDGNDLSLTGTAPAINFIDTDSDDYKIHNVQGLLKITDTTASADRFVINDNGTGYFLSNFQIGSTTTSPGATLHIKSSYPSLKIDDGNNDTNAYIGIIAGTGKESNINFGDPADDDYSQISYDHNGDHMKFKIGGSEKFRVNSNGLCIGGTAAANALDDYEEGVYQPTMTGSSGGSHTFQTFTHLAYTKIGRLVHIQGYININGGSLSGNLKLSLPFTVSNDATGHSRYSAIGLSWRGHGWSGNTGEITFAVQPNTTYGEFVSVAPNGTHIWVNNTHVNNSYNIRIGGCYITNT